MFPEQLTWFCNVFLPFFASKLEYMLWMVNERWKSCGNNSNWPNLGTNTIHMNISIHKNPENIQEEYNLEMKEKNHNNNITKIDADSCSLALLTWGSHTRACSEKQHTLERKLNHVACQPRRTWKRPGNKIRIVIAKSAGLIQPKLMRNFKTISADGAGNME